MVQETWTSYSGPDPQEDSIAAPLINRETHHQEVNEDLEQGVGHHPYMEDPNGNDMRSNHSVIPSILEKIWILVIVILGIVLLPCMLTAIVVIVVPFLMLGNTIVNIIDSMKGEAGKRNLVSPIKDRAAASILLLNIITLSIWFGIVQSVENWKHHTLLGVEIPKWLIVFIILLVYCFLRRGILMMVTPNRAQKLHGLVEVIQCALFFPSLILIIKVVPGWKDHTILGLQTWKWIFVLNLVIVGQNAISILSHGILYVSKLYYCRRQVEKCKGKSCGFYYVKGLKRSMVFVAVSLTHLLFWCLFFSPNIVKNTDSESDDPVGKRVSSFGTWTFVCELICGVLWGMKTFTLLKWKAYTLYSRPSDEVVRKLTNWYCLSLIELIQLNKGLKKKSLLTSKSSKKKQNDSESLSKKLFNVVLQFLLNHVFEDIQQKNEETERNRKQHTWDATMKKLNDIFDQEKKPTDLESSHQKNSIHKNDQKKELDKMYEGRITIHAMENIAWAFKPGDLSLPDEKSISEFLEKWKLEEHSLMNDNEMLKQMLDNICSNELEPHALDFLHTQLQKTAEKTQEGVLTATNLRSWMESAKQSCLQSQYLIGAAREVVSFFDNVATSFILALVIIIWLLLTEVLPTKVLVAISSPFLAATFIFGDTLTTMFQGIVFAYLTHPFAIGDLCIIDKTQMEVKSIGIWRTTFTILGTEEEVLYPNSALANQAIINLATEKDRVKQHDSVEFSLDNATKKITIEKITTDIGRILSNIKNPPDTVGNMKQNAASGSSNLQSHGSIGKDDDDDNNSTNTNDDKNKEIAEDDDDDKENRPIISGTKFKAERSGNHGNNEVMVVKHIEDDNIKITARFMHDPSILDMTHTQAFHQKLIKRSTVLDQIAASLSFYLSHSRL